MRWSAAVLRGLPFLALSVFLACSIRLTDRRQFPEAVTRIQLNPYSQEPDRCGPFALAAVLGHFGIFAAPGEISERIYSPGAGGSLTMDLYLEARRFGLDARQTTGTVQKVREDLDNSSPPILLLRYPSLASDRGHYVVITGYSSSPDGFFLLWGDGGESWIAVDSLLQMWRRSGFWTLSTRAGVGF